MPYVEDAERETIEAARQASPSRMLMRCARDIGNRAIDTVRKRTGQNIRQVHTSLLWHVDLEGIRLTDLAARLEVSKQTASEVVDELVEMRVLERVADPSDGRAKLIRFTRRRNGRLALLDVLDILSEVDADLTATMSPEEQQSLAVGLRALSRVLDARR